MDSGSRPTGCTKADVRTRRCEGIAWCRPHAFSAVLHHFESSHSRSRRLQGKENSDIASQFQTVALDRLGSTPVAMTSATCCRRCNRCHRWRGRRYRAFCASAFCDAAKYVTETDQPAIFLMLEVSQKWYDLLPKDLQEIFDRDGAAVSVAINPVALRCIPSSEGLGERRRRAYQPTPR